MLIGAVLAGPYQGRAADLAAAALHHGLMVITAGSSVLRFAPSLLLDDADLNEGLARLRRAAQEWLAQNQTPA